MMPLFQYLRIPLGAQVNAAPRTYDEWWEVFLLVHIFGGWLDPPTAAEPSTIYNST